MDTAFRTSIKALIWAALGWIIMSAVGLAFTGSLALGGAMAALNSALGLLTYILYERIWARIGWGRVDA